MTAAAQLLDAIVPIVRTRLPRGVDVDYLDDFLDRNRVVLEAVIEQNLGPVLARMQAANNSAFVQEDIPEFWTVAKRTAANVAAMATAAALYAQRRLPSAEERALQYRAASLQGTRSIGFLGSLDFDGFPITNFSYSSCVTS